MKTVDARGRSCPEPVVMTKQALDAADESLLDILVDTQVAKENVCRIIKRSGWEYSIEEKGTEYIIHCKK